MTKSAEEMPHLGKEGGMSLKRWLIRDSVNFYSSQGELAFNRGSFDADPELQARLSGKDQIVDDGDDIARVLSFTTHANAVQMATQMRFAYGELSKRVFCSCLG